MLRAFPISPIADGFLKSNKDNFKNEVNKRIKEFNIKVANPEDNL